MEGRFKLKKDIHSGSPRTVHRTWLGMMQLVRERRNNILGDGMRSIRRDGDDSGGERNEDATRQEAI